MKAHDLVRSIWRLKGYCEDCAKPAGEVQLQGAHVFGTGSYTRLGSDLRNGMCLCSACHRKWTNNPEWKTFVLAHPVGKYYNTLLKMGTNGQRVNWQERLDFLNEIKRAMLANEMTIDEAREYETDY